MKRFIGLFLLLSFFLLSGSGLHADPYQYGNFYSDIKSQDNQTRNNVATTPQDHQLNYSPPVLIKKDYRKIKGIKEEDDDKKSIRQKRTRGSESNAGKYLDRIAALSTSLQTIGQFSCGTEKGTSSSTHFLCANSYRLYNLYQVFRI